MAHVCRRAQATAWFVGIHRGKLDWMGHRSTDLLDLLPMSGGKGLPPTHLAARLAVSLAAPVALGWLAGKLWRWQTVARLRAGSRVVETARGPVEVAVAGQGCPVLLIHGTPGGYDHALAVAQVLDLTRLQVITFSRPGYLRTPLATGRTPLEQADAAAALLAALGLDRVAVVAVSGGGPVGLQLVLRHPARVSRLVLWEAITLPMEIKTGGLTRGLLLNDWVAWALLSLIRLAPGLLVPPTLRTAQLKEQVTALAAGGFPLDLRRAGIRNDAAQMAALTPYPLGRIAVPALVVHGEEDSLVSLDHAQYAVGTLPTARLLLAEHANHATTLVLPEVGRAISAFLLER
jgi:pimeloyl-ACP methyl ester carboxylesterase